jgi:protein CpxP
MLAQDAGSPPPPPQGGQGMGGRNPAEMEQRRLDMMTRQLSLSPDQVTQVKAIMDSQSQQMTALRDGGGPPTGAQREQMMAIRQASNAKIRALLTDDQKTKFDAMEARMQNRQRGGGSDTPPSPPPPPSF